MSKKEKTVQAGDAAYGHALLCNRGGWTLREMLGSDYGKFSKTSEASFAKKDSQESPEKIAHRNQSAGAKSRKRS